MAVAIREQVMMGETVMVMNPELVLIKSKSRPELWHQLEWRERVGWQCDCEGFHWRHICRHLRVANHATDPTEAWERELEAAGR